MKHYIFLQRITGSGGVQCYVTAMSRFLEKKGWHVVVISDNNPQNNNERCVIKELEKFRKDGNPFTLLHPHQIPKLLVSFVLSQMVRRIGTINQGDDVIIESWNSQTAMWGELLAKRINGRHVFWTANERYRGDGRAYVDKIDFYQFKMKRGEIFASVETANRLFEGFHVYHKGDFVECLINEDPVQDIESIAVDNLLSKDWNICYIGRTRKTYVENIIKGISEFAQNHTDKSIQFIIVGNADACRKNLGSIDLHNVTIIELGDQYPIPRKLFKKIDVVIAGSGAARHSTDEGVLTIVADTETCDSRGLLGYDTLSSTYGKERIQDNEKHYSFSEALERALVKKSWEYQEYRWIPSANISDCWNNHESIISHASPQMVYYSKKELLKGSVNYKDLVTILYRIIKSFLK